MTLDRQPLSPRLARCAGLLLAGALSSLGGTAAAENRPNNTLAAPAATHGCAKFSNLALTLEQNASDVDAEVVIVATGRNEGLKRVTVTAPDGRRVADVRGDAGPVGLREFRIESAETTDLSGLLAAFPEGDYQFSATSVTDKCLRGTAALSHRFAPATTLLTPVAGQVVEVDDVVLSWSPVSGVERYVVELNNASSGAAASFDVFPPATHIRVPPRFLVRDNEYVFAVGARAVADGNVSVVELSFFTAP
jgi:hypothetical protein